VREVASAAVLNQKVPANQIWQTRTMLEAIVPKHGTAWGKFGAGEEFAHLLKRSAVLQRETHQAGDDVVETDQFRRTVWAFHAEKDFCRSCVVMHADVERAPIGNSDFLRDVVAASRKKATGGDLSYIGHGFCNSL
jgi:hypothetical protein